MQNYSRAAPKTQQVCPMCHAQLPAGVLYCDACGTDLSRAGVLFSTSVRPVSYQSGGAGRLARRGAVLVGMVAALALGLVGLGSIPEVSARVPVIRAITAPIREALDQAVGWGTQLVGRDRAEPPTPAEPPAPAPPSQPSPPAVPRVEAPGAGLTPYLTVRSSPEPATVYVNDVLVGQTPLTLRQLQPGVYVVRVARDGYPAVARRVELRPNVGATVRLQMKPPAVSRPPSRPAPKPLAGPAAKPAPARPAVPAATVHAPGFTLKDRRGVIYRLSDFRGERLALLVIWDLDGTTEQLIRTLQARTGGRGALVIMVRPNRLALRRFIEANQITIPILLGNPDVAAEYRVPEGISVLFAITDQGRIQSRQIVGRR
ncbi:MAG TPA: PEGA domain-containing protein [bacterium]|nr:PEGA domain-containing protein [bacterium]